MLIEVKLQRHDNMSTGLDNLLFAERQLSSSINRTTHEPDSRSNRTACDEELSPTQSSTHSVYGEPPSMDSSWLSEADCDLTDDSFSMSDSSAIPVIIGNRTQRRQQQCVRSRCVNKIATAPDFVPNVMVSNIRGGLCSKLDEIATTLNQNSVSVACFSES